MAPRGRRTRAREEFVPGAGAGPFPFDVGDQLAFVAGRVRSVSVPPHQLADDVVVDHGDVAAPEVGSGRPQMAGRVAVARRERSRLGRDEEGGALVQLDLDVAPDGEQRPQIPAPCPVVVEPAEHRVLEPVASIEGQHGPPPVVPDRGHRDGRPGAVRPEPYQQIGVHQRVAVGKHVGLDDERLADARLGREPAAVHLGGDGFDHHPRGRIRQRGHPVELPVRAHTESWND